MTVDSIVVEADEDVPNVVERLRQVASEDVELVLPSRCRFAQSRFNFQLLRQYATRLGKRVTVRSADPAVLRMAEEGGFTVRAMPSAERPLRPLGQAGTRPAAAAPGNRPATPGPRVVGLAGAAPGRPAVVPAAGVRAEEAALPGARLADMVGRLAGRAKSISPSVPLGPRVRVAAPQRVPVMAAARLSLPPLTLYAGSVVLLVLGLLGTVFLMPSADVVLVADTRPISSNLEIHAQPGSGPIAVRVVTLDKTRSTTAQATGQQVTRGALAQGEFTYENSCPFTLDIPAGERLRTSDGVEFAQVGDATVESDSTATVPIVATQPGQRGNVGAGQITQIEDNQFGCLQGANASPTSGGVDEQTKTVIQQYDLDMARSLLRQQLEQDLLDELGQQTRQGERFASPPIFTVAQFTTDHNVNDAVPSFTATMTLKVEGDFYSVQDVQRAFAAQLAQRVPKGEQLTSDAVRTQYTVTPSGGGHLDFTGTASGFVAPRLDPAAVAGEVAGKPVSAAQQQLLRTLHVRSVNIRQYPFPLPVLPLLGSRIDVKYEEVVVQGAQA
ncbi:MAG TPA: baseplate J/gp47 family protein [Candidatus Dormibacteraeota bacterium]|nr:baseplate J/gp47 family protein [Candidatus Dormibacteraeota bacterium]